MLTTDLAADLKRLRLPAMADNLDLRTHEAEEGKLGYLEFETLLVQDELASRESNRSRSGSRPPPSLRA